MLPTTIIKGFGQMIMICQDLNSSKYTYVQSNSYSYTYPYTVILLIISYLYIFYYFISYLRCGC